MALAAAWLSPLFPLGLLLGKVATQVHRDPDTEQDPQTLRIVGRSTMLSWFWAVIWVSVCVGLAWWAPELS
ncbi:MAG: hypothetical protein IPL41_08725 [Micropruina sp.]|nr:hypothetical protein [Micropruina sp.]